MNEGLDVIIIGGGAAGYFSAINLAENSPDLKVAILERGKEVLTKVKISGGGRCNVTHAQFDPKELSTNYPRGEKEMLGPFHSFMTGDTIAWFEARGIALKIEEDGRMFPVTDSSQTIIDCFTSEANKLGVSVLKGHSVKSFQWEREKWVVRTSEGEFHSNKLIVATGSNPKIWKLLEAINHTIVSPVPSLFTFNITDTRIQELPGVSTLATVAILDRNDSTLLTSEGPLLVTHWGMSGPAILKLSAWGARLLEPLNYRFKIKVNWLYEQDTEEVINCLKELRLKNARQTVKKYPQFDLPKRLWQNLVLASNITETTTWAELTNHAIQLLANELTCGFYNVEGKSTFKEEFVTAGGIDLKEVNFKTFESRIHQNLYFAGEVLNIDAITGGFNFQNAWTSGFLVAKAISKSD